MKPLAALPSSKIKGILELQRGRMFATHQTLTRIFAGACLGCDSNLVEYVTKIRNSILVKKQRWLVQNIFTEQPRPLFYVEGSSRCILLDHIPETDANVYVVSDYTMVANYTYLMLRLQHDTSVAYRCTYVCTDTVFFTQDLVSTKDSVLAEKHAEKIAYFQAKYK